MSLCLVNSAPRHEYIWGSGGTDPHILTSPLDGDEWSNSHLSRFNSGEKISRFPLDSGLAGPQTRSRLSEEKKRLFPLSRIEPQSIARSFAD